MSVPDKIWATFDEDVSAQTRDVYAQATDEGFVDKPTEYTRTDLCQSAGWQPIETAPKDEIVLLSHEMDGKQLVTQAAYSHEKLIWWPVSEFSVMCENIIPSGASITFQIVDLTHWMPLPAPPVASDKGDAE
jgi:hypothetical protein